MALAAASAMALAADALGDAGGFAGSTAVGPRAYSSTVGAAEAFALPAAVSGVVNRVNIYLDGNSTASSVQLGVYSDKNRRPHGRLTWCTVLSPRAGAWNSCSAPPTNLAAGTTYWIVVLQPIRTRGKIRFRQRRIQGATRYVTSSSSLSRLPKTYKQGKNRPSARMAWSSGRPPRTSAASSGPPRRSGESSAGPCGARGRCGSRSRWAS